MGSAAARRVWPGRAALPPPPPFRHSRAGPRTAGRAGWGRKYTGRPGFDNIAVSGHGSRDRPSAGPALRIEGGWPRAPVPQLGLGPGAAPPDWRGASPWKAAALDHFRPLWVR